MKQPEFDPHRIDRRVLISTLFRFHLAGVAILTWIVAIAEPRSANALIAARTEGFMVLSMLMLAGVVCMLDVVINDLMPESWHWHFARDHRHFALTAMSACYIGQLFVGFNYVRSTPLLAYYLLMGFTTVLFTFVDALHRCKEAQTCPTPALK